MRERTNDGKAMVQFLINVLNGRPYKGIKLENRMKAAEILLDRGYGKPPQAIASQLDEQKEIRIIVKYEDDEDATRI